MVNTVSGAIAAELTPVSEQIQGQNQVQELKIRLNNLHFNPLTEPSGITDRVLKSADEESEKSPDDTLSPSASFSSPVMRMSVMSASNDASAGYGYYLIQFGGPVQTGWKRELERHNVILYDYIPSYTFLARVSDAALSGVKTLPYVRWVGEYKPEYRTEKGVYDITEETERVEQGELLLKVIAFAGEDIARISKEITVAGGNVLKTVSSSWEVAFSVSASAECIEALQKITGIKWIQQVRSFSTNSNIASRIVGARGIHSKAWTGILSPLKGQGQAVVVTDSGIDTGDISDMHPDFGDRVLGNEVLAGASVKDISGHGTHVAGLVAGNGVMSGADPDAGEYPDTCYAGVASEAQLYVQSVGTDDGTSRLPGLSGGLEPVLASAYQTGAKVHTNSWGSRSNSEYNQESAIVDRFMWEHKDYLLLFAGGNRGVDKDANGVTDSYSMDYPATAKNCLSVGATESLRSAGGYSTSVWSRFGPAYGPAPIGNDTTSDNALGMAAFSSRGPALDGRYKPEIVAPGTNLISTRSSVQLGNGWGAYDEYYYFAGGTSMATPVVAGAAALMREYLAKEEAIAAPSAALVKTSLIHGARSIAPGQYGTGVYQEVTAAPDFSQGWGRLFPKGAMNVDPNRTVSFVDNTDSPFTDSGQVQNHTFTVADDIGPFRATLGWTDYPGSPLAGGGLVNDLDLRVRTPLGDWVYPDNARNMSVLTLKQHISSVSGYRNNTPLGVHFTPDTYPTYLESVVVVVSNAQNKASGLVISVYDWNGTGPGELLTRKTFPFAPHGETLFPLGVDISAGSIVVVAEPTDDTLGIAYGNGNPSGTGLQYSGGWSVSAISPAMIGVFREQVASAQFDRVNNTVSVTIPEPHPGTYTVEVSSHNIAMGPQPYALVMSGMTSQVQTSGDSSVGSNPTQPEAPASILRSGKRQQKLAPELNAEYGIALDNVYSDVVSFTTEITGNYGDGLVSMRYAVTGLPESQAQSLALTKLHAGGGKSLFTYPDVETYVDGNWWLTDSGGAFIDPVTTLQSGATYYVVSVVQDNGPFDADPTANIVEDPQVLAPAPASGSGGGGGGCTVGAQSDAGLLVLLAFSLCVAVFRKGRSVQAAKDRS